MDCFLFEEYSLNIIRKFKQITSDLLFTCGTNVPELTGNKNLSQLHIRGSLTCLIPVEKLQYCILLGTMPELFSLWFKKKTYHRYQLLSNLLFVKSESKKQIAKPETTKLKKKEHSLVPAHLFAIRGKRIFKIALGTRLMTFKYKKI